jgi:hypothetical protein
MKKKKTRSLIKKDPTKEVACIRGESGWVKVGRAGLTGVYYLTTMQKENGVHVITNVHLYPHEIVRLYDFLGKVLA